MAGTRRKPTVPPLPPKSEPEPGAGNQGVGSPFPIVGVGASAGGLEAFTQLLQALPFDTGMGFVLVQHLAPERASLLAEILSRATALPVTEVEDEMRIEPDHVYVIPPDRNMTISRGALRLLPRKEARGQHRPIDVFLRALAEDQGHRAIGVVLSGTADDGTLGLEEIKAAGGITFAQDDTAQQTSMPRSAVAAGCVDFVLPPEGIARELAGIARHPSIAPAAARARARSKAPAGEPDLAGILELVRRGTGVDFSEYKTSTVLRRVTRRMVLHRLEGLKDYARLLRKNAREVDALRQDLLINVTSFFRNPKIFEALKARVLPKLFKNRPRLDPLRIWVPGCSTGEEAYSLAILCAELNTARGGHRQVQIFATDLSAAGIDKARAGVYPKSIAHDVSPQRLRRFFAEVDGHYRVAKPIRDLCVFARHNLLTDPPFSQIDLISCRNLLIYLEPAAQERIVPLLHYALKPAGFLVLGSSETVGSYRHLFEVEDARHKVFAKKPGSHREALGRAAGPSLAGPAELGRAPGRPLQAAAETEAQKEVDRILLARFAPPGVLVNADLEIVQFRGDTGPYLAPAPGKASLHLFKMTRQSLLAGLRIALNRARKEEAPVREVGLSVESDDGTREFDLEVIPVRGTSAAAGGFLVLFAEAAPAPPTPPPRGKKGRGKALRPAARPAARDEEADRQIARLAQELAATREYLQSLIEQQEAANEELQSANEEAQSANEELQSVNEELETSKEEIQSSNEELATINDELQDRNLELGQLNNDLLNLLDSVQMAIVVLGPDLRIRRFTPQAGKIFNLLPADVGRPIGDVRLGLSVPDLEPLVAEVVDAVSAIEREVQDRGGRWHSLRIRPYRTLENRFDGAVILLVDVDTLRRARAFAESIVASVREPLLVLDGDLCVQSASPSFYETFRTTPSETEGRRLYELGDGQWQIPALRRLLEEVLPEQSSFDGFEMEWEFEEIGRKIMLLNGRQLVQESGEKPRILLAFEDVTARRQMEETLRQRVGDLTVADRSKNEFLALLAHELRNPLAPLRNAMAVLETPGADRATVERAQQMMRRQVQNMARLIDDLLDVSRITQGKVQLRQERVSLAAALEGAVASVRHQIEAHRQELSLALPRELVELDADPTRLEQIFGNLLANASKFTPEGGHLWVTAEPAVGEEGGDRQVAVRVRDDGIGMTPEALPRVFDLFMQGDRSLARTSGGLGIGLTLVRRLVELHGGRVEAHSAGPGEGSEFVVRLPVLPAGEAKAEARRGGEDSRVADAAPSPVAAAPRRILVVDDSVDAADSLGILLRLQGHDVRVAHDGPAALAVAAAFHPEVVLLDIGLPGLDGYEVARRLRRRRRMTKALLVALTGYGQEDDARRALAAGFDHHLIKPVAPQAIYELVARPRPVTG